MRKHTKEAALVRWAGLEAGQNPLKYMEPISPKTRGSRYGACGVRIDGNPKFVDAVLSCLKPMLDGENHTTRLNLSITPAVTGFKDTPNADDGAEVCYIRLYWRGREGSMASAIFNRDLDGAEQRHEAALFAGR